MKFSENIEIIEHVIKHHYLYLTLKSFRIAPNCQPGQFINIRVNNSYDPLLRRPFSIYDASENTLKIMVLIRGRSTELLAQKKPGDKLNCIGPLGNPFQLPSQSKPPLIIAGGIGIAPFLYFIRQCNALHIEGTILLFGAKNSELIPPLDDFSNLCRTYISTEDGSVGQKGNVLDLMRQFDLTKYTLYACGPTAMLAAVQNYLREIGADIKAYLTLETYMACGFGACKGCAVETTDGNYQLCCQDGPTFSWDKIRL